MAPKFVIDQRVKHTVAGSSRMGTLISFRPEGQALIAWDAGNASVVKLSDLRPL